MDERVKAKKTISYFMSQRGISLADLGVAPNVAVSWSGRIVKCLVDKSGLQQSQHWIYEDRYPLYAGKVKEVSVSIALLPVGSSATVMVMEEMIACGARVFLGLGLAGSLQPKAPVGTCIIPTSCIREEGTSLHYIENDTEIGPSPRLAELLKKACEDEGLKVYTGPIWTTDAPYRELSTKIDTYRRKGVLCVDMETSAVYALGTFRGVQVCNLLLISDELWEEWRPAFFSSELRNSIERAGRVILQCIAERLPIEERHDRQNQQTIANRE